MKLEKAIEIKEAEQLFHPRVHYPDIWDANQISLEAMKRLRELRENIVIDELNLLPGETEDYCKFCGLAHTGIECPSREREK